MKTHSELGITADEHAALIATIEVLRSEQIIFDMSRSCSVQSGNEDEDEDREDDNRAFEPGENTAESQSPCGTACCIGGTMSLLMQNGMKLPAQVTPEMGDAATRYVCRQDNEGMPLKGLFWDVVSERVKPADGIVAIEQFLDGNVEDPWHQIG